MNNINDLTEKTCCGCGMCAIVCPVRAVTMQEKDGFYFPKVDEKNCVNCGKCKTSCIKFQDVKTAEPINVYAAKNKDKSILMKSSSGGVAFGLCKLAIEQGYRVLACKYDTDEHIAVHALADTQDDLECYFGSKYMQSQFWREIAISDLLNMDKKFLVIGTPCQIFALNSVLNGKNARERFILVDLFCHGAPSRLIWDNAIKAMTKKYGKVVDVQFRSKRKGWHSYINDCKTEDGRTHEEKEHFYDIFFSDKVLNKSCYDCEVRKSFYYSDIRIGDFWGDKFNNDKEGVSLLCLNSERGAEFFSNIANIYTIEKVDDEYKAFNATKNNDAFSANTYKKIIEKLKTGSNGGAYRMYLKELPIKKRLTLTAKKIYNKLPYKLRASIKSLYYKKKAIN